jgi:hypothetical protein
VVSEITKLAEEVATLMEEVREEFITKVDFHHTRNLLESETMSVQGRLSSPVWWESSAILAPPYDETSKSTFGSSPPPPPPPLKPTITQPAPTWSKVPRKPRKKVATLVAMPVPAAANT